MKRRRVDGKVGDSDRLLEEARQVPLTDPDYAQLKTALHALVDTLAKASSTEKPETASSAKQDPASDGKASGHGHNGDAALESARKVETRHQQLKTGDRLLQGVTAPRCGVAGEPG
jgi:hypothetical protein